MHQKRNKIPRRWPLPRKGTKFVVSPNDNKNTLPALIILRDMLKIAKTKKEAKAIIQDRQLAINEKKITDEKATAGLFDKISLLKSKKYYQLSYEKSKYNLEEISESETHSKTSKVINKKLLGKDKLQINLNDGRNILSNEKISVGDSVIISFKDNKIQKILPIKKEANIVFIKGKHLGKKGKIIEINEDDKTCVVDSETKINTSFDNIMAVEQGGKK